MTLQRGQVVTDKKLIDLNEVRQQRVHELNDRRLQCVRQAFEQAFPMDKQPAKKRKKRGKKKRSQ